MAGALGLKLSGPRVYHGALTDEDWIGEGREEASAADIRRALGVYKTACTLQIAALGRPRLPHLANLSRRSTSICASRWSASASSVL